MLVMVDDLDDLGDLDIMQPPSEHTHTGAEVVVEVSNISNLDTFNTSSHLL